MDPQKTPAPNPQDQDSELPEQSVAGAAPGAPPTDSSDSTLSDLGLEGSEAPDETGNQPDTPSTDSTPEPSMPSSTSDTATGSTPDANLPDSETQTPDESFDNDTFESDQPSKVVTDAGANPLPVTSHKHGKKGMFVGLIAAATLLLLSGGAAAAYYYVMNKPDNVLKMALANTLDLSKNKTTHFSGALTIKDTSSGMNTQGTYQGEVNNQTGAFSLSGSMDLLLAKLGIDVRSVDGKTVYVKVDGLSELGGLLGATGTQSVASLYTQLIASVNNQWLEINPSITEQLGVASPLKDDTFSDADKSKLMDVYQQNAFLIVKQKMPDEAIKGAKSYHFKLGLDKAKLKSFVLALKNAKLKSLEITEAQLKSFNSSVDGADLSKLPVEVWIAKSTKMISQVSVNVSESGTSVNFRFTVDSYNKPVNVEKPEGAKSLMEVITGFYTQLTGGTELSLPDLENSLSH